MKSVGIDIGTSSIKIVEALATNRGVQLTSFREFPLGTNPAFDQEIEIVDILRSLAAQYDPTKTRMVAALRQDFVSTRLKTFPFTERQKILKSLPFELEEDLPFSSETAIYDARICQYVGSQAEVLAVAAPKNKIQQTLRRVQDSGVDLTILTAEALAYSNLFENWSAPPKATAMPGGLDESNRPFRRMNVRLHIGHTHTLVLAYEGDLLVGVRSILWGAKSVADAIARRYEIPFVEAISEMRKKAFVLLNKSDASYDQILFSDTIATQVRDLGKELKISLLEFETELHGEIENVELTGGFSQTLNLHAYLTQILERPVNRARFLDRYTTLFEKTPAVEAIIGVALGLALEGLRKPRNPAIQFLRQEFAKQGSGFAGLWKEWGPSIQFAGGLFAILLVYSNLRMGFSADLVDKVNEALKKQAREVAGLNPRQANEAGIRRYVTTQRQRVKEVKEIESFMQMNTSLDVLKRLSEVMPGHNQVKLTIRKLNIKDQVVEIEGVAGSADQVKVIEGAMKSIAKGPIRLSVAPPAPNSAKVSFSMNFDVDRGLVAANR